MASLRARDWAIWLCVLLMVAWSGLAPALASEPSREDRIKAAIVYKVGKFVDWPSDAFAGPDAPLQVCLVGDDPFANALSDVEGQRVQGRRILFRIIESNRRLDEGQCHILFFPRSAALGSPSMLRGLAGKPVLTISDLPGFARRGGMIALVRAGDRLSFEIDPQAAREAGLSVRAQLLDLADIVEP